MILGWLHVYCTNAHFNSVKYAPVKSEYAYLEEALQGRTTPCYAVP